MRIEPLGDCAYILRDLPAPAHVIARQLNLTPPEGLIEAVASYDTVAIYGNLNPDSLLTVKLEDTAAPGRLHRIPVCYELGEDLEAVAATLGLTPEQVSDSHSSVEYTCYAVGFCPGFAYLGYMPDAIAGIPRMPAPRIRVEPGSVGMTGRQTAVYPLPRPGGWSLVGKTPLTLVDVADGYFPIEAGDTVTFQAIGTDDFNAFRGERL
jgi:inhibitor of KinA